MRSEPRPPAADEEPDEDLAEGPDSVGLDHSTSTPTNLLEGSEPHRKAHSEHCERCGKYLGPVGSCKDCFPPLEPDDPVIDYILDTAAIRAWVITGLLACLIWAVILYVV